MLAAYDLVGCEDAFFSNLVCHEPKWDELSEIENLAALLADGDVVEDQLCDDHLPARIFMAAIAFSRPSFFARALNVSRSLFGRLRSALMYFP